MTNFPQRTHKTVEVVGHLESAQPALGMAKRLGWDVDYAEVTPDMVFVHRREPEQEPREPGRIARFGHALLEAAKNNIANNIFHP